jgi:hypothetical protein
VVQNPFAMQRGLMAVRAQAEAWIQGYKAHLATYGLGFPADVLALIAAEAAEHPVPEGMVAGGEATAEQKASAMEVAAKALAAEYPEDGFAADDPRLATPAGGIALVAYAVAARAIGWSTDRPFIEQVVGALGHTGAEWDASVDEWTRRITGDIVLAYLYGQLFSQVGELPRR